MTFASKSSALPPTQIDYEPMNLESLIINDASGVDLFPYILKPPTAMTFDLMKRLEATSTSKIVSPIYEKVEVSRLKNVYVFVGKTFDDGRRLFVIRESETGAMHLQEFNIVNVEKDMLTLQHGPANQIQTYVAFRAQRAAFLP